MVHIKNLSMNKWPTACSLEHREAIYIYLQHQKPQAERIISATKKY